MTTSKITIPRGYGVVSLLLLAVLVPSACLLWFMNQAVQNERLAVRQKLLEAYRGHLTLLQQRLEDYLSQTATNLDAAAQTASPAALFAHSVRAGVADSMICFDASGNVTYPAPLPVAHSGNGIADPLLAAAWSTAHNLESSNPTAAAEAFGKVAAEATNASIAARALQSQARLLAQSGLKDAALLVLTQSLANSRFAITTDLQGRLIVPNAELLALELCAGTQNVAHSTCLPEVRQRLKTQLLDYDSVPMPAAQRRFLMHELQRLFADQFEFPTLAAEDLAARYLASPKPEAGSNAGHAPGARALSPAPLPGVWQFFSSQRRAVLLLRADTMPTRVAAWVPAQTLPSDVSVAVVPPGKEADKFLLSTPAGPFMPGWRLALSLKDQRFFDAAVDARIASYVWIGALVLLSVVILALLLVRLLRRQLVLTQLRNDLVANVTHELKTPLSSMRLLVETLLNSPQLNEQTAREYLQLIATENLRLSRLIDNFLTFSRIERNKYTFRFNPVPALKLIEAAVASVRERFSAPGCHFEVKTPSQLPSVVADSDAMVTALVNLLDNAYKYSGDDKQITLSADSENGSVRFAIKDNGVGLSSRDTKRIFKRFYQVDQRLSRTGGGCGLGLSIVKFIVAAHDGDVRVDSTPGKGSIFTVTLPVQSGT